ncbi:cell wall-associated NlpC family hydrolase [Kribbella sp. VKM Ac-2527]|uniref:Cell wall-associated NlpC family hydrolase n=1 Tax=Kribbella caucasensis TaxID=2512215 RepID=A0A4R6KNP9_9ACTN|nr:C40 family peptidase [Kribbella sp. VKM Ac-2527]TDO54266.1 cell wall-associated NlpC family hydrolase [Kribbella sp. VKM Ac-2527]
MRTPKGAESGSRGGSTGKTGRALLSGVLAVSLAGTMALIPMPAQADPKPPVIPSQAQVNAAKKAAADKAAQVAAIEQQLAAANNRLEQLGRESGIAAEKYNGAVYRLQQAKIEAAAAAARAQKAAKTLAGQQRQIGRFAAASYQGGGDLAKFGSLFTPDGPQQLLDSAGAARSVSQAMQGSYLRFTATRVVSNAFKAQADQAVAKVKTATEAAAKAKAAAEAAEANQAAAVAGIGAERKKQISQLAVLRNTSYQVADQRQRGLEELARQRAAAIAAKKAEELRKRIAAREAADRAREAAEQRAREERERREQQQKNNEKPAKPPKKKQKPSRPGGGNDGGSYSGRGAAAAIAFALSQLGEPYVWGADGPGSWDCSGLTMGAWERAGVQLPHYSVAQYEQVRHISEDELRPGDLIFWAENHDDPGTIFHVAMYLGGGRMVHAPRAGRPVTIDSIYYWEDPDFFGRP